MSEIEGWFAGFAAFFLLILLLVTQGVRCNRDDNVARIKSTEQLARLKTACVQAGRPALECDQLRLP